jgi:hypothetical protein
VKSIYVEFVTEKDFNMTKPYIKTKVTNGATIRNFDVVLGGHNT